MITIQQQCISASATILESLRALDALSGRAMVLFVRDEAQRVVGTITDGDIRRALIGGAELTTRVDSVMHRSFAFLRVGAADYTQDIQTLRKRNITIVPLLDEENRLLRIYDLNHTRSILPIDAVLMAGGKGERLRPLTEKTPKPLLPVGGKAIIDHNVERLASYGVEHITATVNYLGNQLVEHFSKPIEGVQVQTVSEPQFLGTIGAVQGVPEVHNDVVLVMNSDLFTDIDYEDFYLHFRQHNADMSVAAVPYTVSVPYGIMDLDNEQIRGLIEKPRYNYYANAGIYLIKRSMLERIPSEKRYDATNLINDLVAEGRCVVRYPLNGTWIDIGNPQEYAKAQDIASRTK